MLHTEVFFKEYIKYISSTYLNMDPFLFTYHLRFCASHFAQFSLVFPIFKIEITTVPTSYVIWENEVVEGM